MNTNEPDNLQAKTSDTTKSKAQTDTSSELEVKTSSSSESDLSLRASSAPLESNDKNTINDSTTNATSNGTSEASETIKVDNVEETDNTTPQAATDKQSLALAPNSWQKTKALLYTFFTRPAVMMVCSVFLFSLMVLFVKLASRYYTSFEIISFRGFVGAACLLAYLQIMRGHSISFMKTSYFGMHIWRSFIGCLSMTCWFYGIARLTLSISNTISYMSSIWIALFIIASAMMTGKSRPDYKLIFAILIGFSGIVVIMRPSGSDLDLWACFIVLLSSIFTALAYLQVAALGRIGEPTYRTVFYFCMFGGVFGLLCAAIFPPGFSSFSWTGIGFMFAIGILATLAQLFLTTAYTKGNALVNASLQYLGLVFVIIFDWILGETWPDQFTLLGMGLVVSSGLLATILKSKNLPGVAKHAKHHH